MPFGLTQSIALAFGGVGFSSPFLALRGRLVVGLGDGKAKVDDVAVSGATVGTSEVSGATADDAEVSSALSGSRAVSGATVDDVAVSGATVGDEPEC